MKNWLHCHFRARCHGVRAAPDTIPRQGRAPCPAAAEPACTEALCWHAVPAALCSTACMSIHSTEEFCLVKSHVNLKGTCITLWSSGVCSTSKDVFWFLTSKRCDFEKLLWMKRETGRCEWSHTGCRAASTGSGRACRPCPGHITN